MASLNGNRNIFLSLCHIINGIVAIYKFLWKVEKFIRNGSVQFFVF